MRAGNAGRKLQMICGESNGPPYDRLIARLEAMLPKAAGDVPEDVTAFIANAVDHLEKSSKALAKSNPIAAGGLSDQADALGALLGKKPAKKAKAEPTADNGGE